MIGITFVGNLGVEKATDRVDPERVGVAGICVGASLVLIAAQDLRINEKVKFVNFFAGYYDAFDFIRAIASRTRFNDNYSDSWDTDDLTLTVFTYHLLEGVTSELDRGILNNIFFPVEGSPPADAGSLTEEGRAVYEMLKGVPFDEVDHLMETLSPETRTFLKLISPSTYIDDVKAQVLIMHDVSDRLVPSEESLRLVKALEKRGNVYHTQFSFFQNEVQVHRDESIKTNALEYVKEAHKLYMHIYEIMRIVE